MQHFLVQIIFVVLKSVKEQIITG